MRITTATKESPKGHMARIRPLAVFFILANLIQAVTVGWLKNGGGFPDKSLARVMAG
jgi:hypothetical protein